MKFKRQRELKRTKIEIIPMIDTMFFLLVFFMLSSLALTKMVGLPVNLPKSANAPRQNSDELTITIDKDQQVFLNRDRVTMEDLPGQLSLKAGGPSANLAEATVIINADTAVPHGFVVKCIDQARAIGITHFAIATAPQ